MPLPDASRSTSTVCGGTRFGRKGIFQKLSLGQFKTILDLPVVCCVDTENQSTWLFTPFIGDKVTFARWSFAAAPVVIVTCTPGPSNSQLSPEPLRYAMVFKP